LQYVSQTSKTLLDASKVRGYDCEKQLECIDNIDAQKRMLFVDSSGGSVRMTKQMNDEYQRVLLMKQN